MGNASSIVVARTLRIARLGLRFVKLELVCKDFEEHACLYDNGLPESNDPCTLFQASLELQG